MHCWLFCSFDAVNSTKVESLHTECCWTFSYVCTWEVTSRACASPRIICRGTLSWCCDVWPRSPSNMDDASWGGRAARLWCVCLRAAANTASGGHFYCFSFHFSWHVKKKKKKRHRNYFSQAFFSSFFLRPRLNARSKLSLVRTASVHYSDGREQKWASLLMKTSLQGGQCTGVTGGII